MISSGVSNPSRRLAGLALLSVAALVGLALFGLPGTAGAKPSKKKTTKKEPRAVGRVYTETNGTSNAVLIFNRYANGSLKQIGSESTGGAGGFQNQPGCTPPGGCPFLDTQNEVVITPAGTLVFAVNAGSNTITSFRATHKGLKRVSVVSSDGVFPNSLTLHGNLLYALNSNSLTITGFRFNALGTLTHITGSTQSLVGGAIPTLPRQIGFDNSGRVLMVTLLANMAGPPPAGGTKDTIDTFPVNAAGVAGKGTAHNSTGKFPFAFAFDSRNQAVVAQVNELSPTPGTAQRYTAAGSPIGSGVTTKQFAPCWVVVTGSGRYVFIVNTGGGAPGGATIAEYKVLKGGALKLLGTTEDLKDEFLKTDEALSSDGRYLYVLAPLAGGTETTPDGMTKIDIYKVHGNGHLKLIRRTTVAIPALSGIAAT